MDAGRGLLRVSHCLENLLIDGGEIVSLTRCPQSDPQKYFVVQTSA
jgi:hypothetical protein